MDLAYLIYLAKMGSVDIHPGGRAATLALLAALNLSPGDRVLEIGCGTGGTLVRIPKELDLELYAVDLLPEMLATARERVQFMGYARYVQLVRACGGNLPFPEGFFDKIFAESVLGFQETRVVQDMLAEAYRLLKPGGLFAANEAIWREKVEEETVAKINRGCETDFGLRQATDIAWDINDWLQSIDASGFDVLSANLLYDHTNKIDGALFQFSWQKSLVSWFVYRYLQMRSLFIPRMYKWRFNYQSRLQNHKGDGRFVEERLFVLRKT